MEISDGVLVDKLTALIYHVYKPQATKKTNVAPHYFIHI